MWGENPGERPDDDCELQETTEQWSANWANKLKPGKWGKKSKSRNILLKEKLGRGL